MKGFEKLGRLAKNVSGLGEKYQREIKLGVTVAGVVLTGISAARAGIKAYKILEEQRTKLEERSYNHEEDRCYTDEEQKEIKKEITIETVKRLTPVVLPPVVIGSASIWSAVSSYNVASKQIAAITAAYNITEKSFNEFQNKAKEILGEKKAEEIRDEANIAGLNAAYNSGGKDEILETGKGNVLFWDRVTGTFFRSNWESIRAAVNTVHDNWLSGYYDDDDEVSYGEIFEELNIVPKDSLAADAFVFKRDKSTNKRDIRLRTTSVDHVTFEPTMESATVIDFMTRPTISHKWLGRDYD